VKYAAAVVALVTFCAGVRGLSARRRRTVPDAAPVFARRGTTGTERSTLLAERCHPSGSTLHPVGSTLSWL